jgi:tetratricopeptide (TPR) repeat protein
MAENQAQPDPPPSAKTSPASISKPERISGYGRKNRMTARLAVFSTLVCLLTIGGVAWIVYPQAVAASSWRKARRAIDDYDFESARRHLEECLKVWPQSAETRFLMARTCRRDGDFDQARQYLKEAKRLNWVQPQIQLEYLLMKAQEGLVRQVEPRLRQSLTEGKGDETIIFEALVIGCLQDNLLDEAHQWVTDWIKNFPDDWHARFWKARILEAGLRYDLAAEEYQQVLENNPGHAESHLRGAEMLLKGDRFSEALPHFQVFLQKDPHSPAALLGLARCQRSLEPPAVARATVDQLLADHPDFAAALLLRGRLELDIDNPQEALDWLRRAEELAPFDRDVNQNLAITYRLLKKDQEAAAYERKRQKIDQDYRRMEELTKLIIENPRNVSLRYEAGSILVGLGNLREGMRWLVSALLIDPGHQPSRSLFAQCLEKVGNPELVEAYRSILENLKDSSRQGI